MKKRDISFRTKILNCLRLCLKNALGEKILIALLGNKRTYDFAYKIAPNYYQYKPNSMRRCVRNSMNWMLDLSDYMEHLYYFGLKVEPRKRLFDLVEDGMVICDVGANFGETALHMSKLNPNGIVYAFEPFPKAFQKLEKNLSLNGFDNCRLNYIALSDKKEELAIQLTEVQNSGSAYLKEVSDDDETKVQTITLDEYIGPEGDCSLIKIDVEGFEKKVLGGAKKTLQEHRPLLFVEIDESNLKRQKTSASDTIAFIKSFNYAVHYAETLEQIFDENNLEQGHFDVICKPQ